METIRLTKEQETELENMSRAVTSAERAALNQAWAELANKGLVQSGENFMTLYRAYNAAPQAPITVQSILDFTAKFRDAFEWLSATELAYNQLTAQIGPDKTAEVTRLLKSHKLYAPPDEQGMDNFVTLVRHSQTQGWGLDRDSFHRLISHLQRYVPNAQLYWSPTSSQQAQRKRWDATRAPEQPKSIKEQLEIVKAKAATVAHIVNPDGTRMSDTILHQFYEAHPEALEAEAPIKTPAQEAEDVVDNYWKDRTQAWLRSLSGTLGVEAEQQFGHPLHGSWRASYAGLENWLSHKNATKPELWA